MASSTHTTHLRPVVDRAANAAAEKILNNAARDRSVRFKAQADMAAPLRSFDLIDKGLGRITGSADQFSESMGAANARVLAFGASVGIMNAVADAIKNVVNVSIQVEHAMKQVEIITGDSTAAMAGYKKELFSIATETASSFEKTSQTMLEFGRAGLAGAEALEASSTAMKFARVTGADMEVTMKALMASYQQFAEEGLTYASIADKISAADLKSSVSARDLADAVSRSAAIIGESGTSFEQLLGMITAVVEKTKQSGSVIGNFMKRLSADMVQPENKNYIEDVLGVSTTNADRSLRPIYDIVKDIAEVTRNMPNIEQIGENLAGAFNINNMVALLKVMRDGADGISEVEQKLREGGDAVGSLDERNKQLNETLLASIERIKTMGTALADSFGNAGITDALKVYSRELEKVLKFFAKDSTVSDSGQSSGEIFGKTFIESFSKTAISTLTSVGIQAALFALIMGAGKLAKFAFDSFQTFTGIQTQSHKINNLTHILGDTLSKNNLLEKEFLSLMGNTKAQSELLVNNIKHQILEQNNFTNAVRASAAEMIKLNSISIPGGKLKNITPRASSITTHANPLNNPEIVKAVRREIELGAVPSQIRVGQQGKFRNSSNPNGYVVTNTRDEPTGYVPNFAFASPAQFTDKQLATYLAGTWKPEKGQQLNTAAAKKELLSRTGKTYTPKSPLPLNAPLTPSVRVPMPSSLGAPSPSDMLQTSSAAQADRLAKEQARLNYQAQERQRRMSVPPPSRMEFGPSVAVTSQENDRLAKEYARKNYEKEQRTLRLNDPSKIEERKAISTVRKRLNAMGGVDNVPKRLSHSEMYPSPKHVSKFDEMLKTATPKLTEATNKLAAGFGQSTIAFFALSSSAGGLASTIDEEKDPIRKASVGVVKSIADAGMAIGVTAMMFQSMSTILGASVAALGAPVAIIAGIAALVPELWKLGKAIGDKVLSPAFDTSLDIKIARDTKEFAEVNARFKQHFIDKAEAERKNAELAEQESILRQRNLQESLKAYKIASDKKEFENQLRISQSKFDSDLSFKLSQRGRNMRGGTALLPSELETQKKEIQSSFESKKQSAESSVVKGLREQVLDAVLNNPKFIENRKEYDTMTQKMKSEGFQGDLLSYEQILLKKLKDAEKNKDAAGIVKLAKEFGDLGDSLSEDAPAFKIEGLLTEFNQKMAEYEQELRNAIVEADALTNADILNIIDDNNKKIKAFRESENKKLSPLQDSLAIAGLSGNARSAKEFEIGQRNTSSQLLEEGKEIQNSIWKLEKSKAAYSDQNSKEAIAIQGLIDMEFERLDAFQQRRDIVLEILDAEKKIFENQAKYAQEASFIGVKRVAEDSESQINRMLALLKRAESKTELPVGSTTLKDVMAERESLDDVYAENKKNTLRSIQDVQTKISRLDATDPDLTLLYDELSIAQKNLETLEKTYEIEKKILDIKSERARENQDSFRLGVQDALDELDTRPLGQVLGYTIPNAFRDGLQGAMQAAIQGTDDLGSALMSIAAGFADAISNAAMGYVANQVTGSIFSGLGFAGYSAPTQFSSGGVVKNGSGYKDDVPAMLTKGEFVIRRERAQKLGYNYLNALNSGKVKGYNSGGTVSNDLFIPGSPRAANQGAISGESDLLRFAQQQTTSGSTDKITASGSQVGIDLEDQSKRLSVFALAGDNKIAKDVKETQAQSFDAIFGYRNALKQWREQKEAIKKQNEAKLMSAGVGLAVSIGAAGLMAGFSSGAPTSVNQNPVGSTPRTDFGSNVMLAADGGFINRGSGIKDDVPAMLMKGEYVLNADAVRRIGKPKLDSMNRKMAEGGFVNETDTGDMIGDFGDAGSGGGSMTKMLESIVEKLATIIQDNSNEINITINNSGDGVSAFSEPNSARGLAERIRPIVVEEMVKQKRLGGINRER